MSIATRDHPCFIASQNRVLGPMCGNDANLAELLTTAGGRSVSFFDALSALHDRGNESIANQIYDDFVARYRKAFGTRPAESTPVLPAGETTSRKEEQNSEATASENVQGRKESPPAQEQQARDAVEDQTFLHEVKQSGIESRDIQSKWLKDRSINATLRSDILLIFLARNPAGVISGDVFDELDRLKLREPVGTIRSRISELRKFDLVEQRSDSGSGLYKLTAKGLDAARKAIRKYGFSITL